MVERSAARPAKTTTKQIEFGAGGTIKFFVSFFRKQIITMAKKTFTEKMNRGMNRGRKREMDSEDALYEVSRCNSYDFEAGMTRDSDTVCFKERHLVPVEVVQAGLARFNLMLDMSAPGTVPDPLLIAALIDLVSYKISRPLF